MYGRLAQLGQEKLQAVTARSTGRGKAIPARGTAGGQVPGRYVGSRSDWPGPPAAFLTTIQQRS